MHKSHAASINAAYDFWSSASVGKYLHARPSASNEGVPEPDTIWNCFAACANPRHYAANTLLHNAANPRHQQ
jgi:hypothetical protein